MGTKREREIDLLPAAVRLWVVLCVLAILVTLLVEGTQ